MVPKDRGLLYAESEGFLLPMTRTLRPTFSLIAGRGIHTEVEWEDIKVGDFFWVGGP